MHMKCFSTTLVGLGWLAAAVAANAGTSLELLWNVLPGNATYVTNANTERGIAYHSGADRVLLVSRAGGIHVVALNAVDGSFDHELDVTGISGSNAGVPLNMVGVADDGVIYACNLIVGSSTVPPPAGAFKIYRWADEGAATVPSIAFSGDPSGTTGDPPVSVANLRWGDTMSVRGSGIDTQILVGSGSTAVCIFTTSDGTTFTPHFIDAMLETGGSKGISFGTGDTFYSKANGGAKKLRRSSFTLTTNTGALLNDITVTPNTGIQFVPIALDLANQWWGTFETGGAGQEVVKIYDIGASGTTPVLLQALNLPTDNTNSNAVGSAAFGPKKLFICDTNNGILAYNIETTSDVIAPAVTVSPASRTVYDRGQTTFTVTATGTPPLTYKWFKDDVEIAGETLPSLTVNPVASGSAGTYKCQVSNTAPNFAESTPATLTVAPSLNTDALTECWHVAPGSRAYLQNDDTQRGLDYNPVTGRVYVASRTPSAAIRVLDAATGADLHALDMTGITNTGSQFPINMVAVAEDGVIYACNLSNITDGSKFRLFRWADDQPTTQPERIYPPSSDIDETSNLFDADGSGPTIGTRVGDTLDVRGSGASTLIVVGARNVSKFAIFSTLDGLSFNPTTYDVPGASFGLSVVFGAGDTLWGKSAGQPLSFLSLNLVEGTASLVHQFSTAVFPGSAGVIGLDPVNGCLAANEIGNSDNVRLYTLPTPFPTPAPASLTLLDQEFYTTDNDNLNGTGAVSVAGNKVFALNSGNGIVCYSILKPVNAEIGDVSYDRVAQKFTMQLKGGSGRSYQIQRSPDLIIGTWTDDGIETIPANATEVSVTRDSAAPRMYFRAVPLP